MSSLNNPLFILHAAVDFFENGIHAAAKHFMIKEGISPTFNSLTHPKLCLPIVNITFSLELTFKGIIQTYATRLPKTHNLLNLFNTIKPDLRVKIIEHYANHDNYKSLIAVRLLEGDGINPFSTSTILTPTKDEKGVLFILEQHKLHFEAFRYLHEFRDPQEHLILFREICNLTYSSIFILGELQGKQVVSVKKGNPKGSSPPIN